MFSKAHDRYECQTVAKSPTRELLIIGAQSNQKEGVVCERRRREQKNLGDLDILLFEKYQK